jgi:hypothetical protein
LRRTLAAKQVSDPKIGRITETMYSGVSKLESHSSLRFEYWRSPPPSPMPNVSQTEEDAPPATANYMAAIQEITRDLTADKDSDSSDGESAATVKAKDRIDPNDGNSEGDEESIEDDGSNTPGGDSDSSLDSEDNGSNTPDDDSDSSSDSDDGGVRLDWANDPHLRDLTVHRVLEGDENTEEPKCEAEGAVEHSDDLDGP